MSKGKGFSAGGDDAPPANRGEAAERGGGATIVKLEPKSRAPGKDAKADGKSAKDMPKRRGINPLTYVGDDIELWHDPRRKAFATVSVNTHKENMAIDGENFRDWLSERCYRQTGSVPAKLAMDNAIATLRGRARFDGACHKTYRRVGEAFGSVIIDIGDSTWSAIVIDETGWYVAPTSPAKFVRSDDMQALPRPKPCPEGIEAELGAFIRAETLRELRMVATWLVAALIPGGPYPVLSMSGPPGSGKSVACRLLRRLVDPNLALLRMLPEKLEDVMVSAQNSHMLAFDNVSGFSGAISDLFCQISTGAGYAARRLYSDDQEFVFSEVKQILVNGIPDLVGRPDLQSRIIPLRMMEIAEGERESEAEFLARFAEAAPRILGALCDGIQSYLRNRKDIKIPNLPRMADFAMRGAAAAQGLGWTAEEFLEDYEYARAAGSAISLEQSVVAAVLLRFMAKLDDEASWQGSATLLLACLKEEARPDELKAKAWPHTPNALGTALRLLTDPLKSAGIKWESHKSGRDGLRTLFLKRIG